ncbi:hypothetical protein [Streptomyces sp. NPDC053079]|uniref:hypothetical protein n=1 Tax=Streptomyces sp. NPDC053079 TaxID=3365697 RepID=UPI0037D0E6F5
MSPTPLCAPPCLEEINREIRDLAGRGCPLTRDERRQYDELLTQWLQAQPPVR